MATYLGWNLRRTGFAEGALCSVTGFTIPLAATRAEREASGDPRLSIEERYPTHGAVKRLVKERLYLEEDAARVMEEARRKDVGKPSS